MSAFSQHKEENIHKLEKLFTDLMLEHPAFAVKEAQSWINKVRPTEIVGLVDRLMQQEMPMPQLKKGINKLLNLLSKHLNETETILNDPFLKLLSKDNQLMINRLQDLKADIKQVNEKPERDLATQIAGKFAELERFEKHYSLIQNILFPLLEKHWNDYRCISVMWSYHDDVKRNLHLIKSILHEQAINLPKFNQLSGEIYFSMYAMKFREEKILFQLIPETIAQDELEKCYVESIEHGFAYLNNFEEIKKQGNENHSSTEWVDLETGTLSSQQIALVFNHLPVDITFVDENNKVKYFSSPKKRTFTRTRSIIGRDVKNCHPPDSVDIVEKIVEEFRSGKRDEADFRLHLKGEYLYIRYFAVRDAQKNYRGVIEVTQDITDIQNLTGDKRLLDWD